MAEPRHEPVKLLLFLPSQLQAEAFAAFLRARIGGCQVTSALRVGQAVSSLETQGPFDLLIWGNAEYSSDPSEVLETLHRAQPALRIAVLASTSQPDRLAAFVTDSVAGIVPATTPADVAISILEILATGGRCVPQLVADTEPATNGARMAEAPEKGAPISILSRRQLDVLQLLSRAESNKAIARLLGVGENTVKTHVKQIMRRLGVKNRTEAALLASRLGVRGAAAENGSGSHV